MVKSEKGIVELNGDICDIAADISTAIAAVHDYEKKIGLSTEKFDIDEASFFISNVFISFFNDRIDMSIANTEEGFDHMLEASRTLVKTLLSVYGKEKSDE